MERIKNLIKKQNVIGYAESNKEVVVLVTKKLSMKDIAKKIVDPTTPWTFKDIVPKTIRKYFFKKKKTKVLEIGHVSIEQDRKQYDPLKGGCEIGVENERFVGTAGAIVKYKEWTNPGLLKPLKLIGEWAGMLPLLQRWGFKIIDRPAILTNCHVTQDSVDEPVETTIVQPGMTHRIIGKTLISTPILPNQNNNCDASIIEITGGKNEIIQVGQVQNHTDVHVGDKVKKYGRTTKFTEGVCEAKNVVINVDYGNKQFRKLIGTDMFSNMSSPGDSGSVIVNEQNKAVSLLFAGSRDYTFGIPIKTVVKKLNISF